MDSLTDLIRGDETYVSIEPGKCKVCGEPYALIHGSNRTFRKDGRRYAKVNCEKIGWGSFRCSRCKEVIEETWVRVKTTSPTI